ncbi:hypothetical protein HYC85_031702 [Camellia sinensis]|uniref:Uncharacterized protein n=1 Tax=Camellia sinensis TaxID=4442 RepID=A0A7J7FRG2_CAMSI|nr:hypothetical protein HYC85_031702 [Camellia sinensis]
MRKSRKKKKRKKQTNQQPDTTPRAGILMQSRHLILLRQQKVLWKHGLDITLVVASDKPKNILKKNIGTTEFGLQRIPCMFSWEN